MNRRRFFGVLAALLASGRRPPPKLPTGNRFNPRANIAAQFRAGGMKTTWLVPCYDEELTTIGIGDLNQERQPARLLVDRERIRFQQAKG